MDLYLQSMLGGGKRNAPPPYQQGQRPPRMQPPPPPYIPNPQSNSYPNLGYNHQNRPNPPPRPPPPPFINAPGGNYGKGRPYDQGPVRQNESEFVGNRNVSNQRFAGGRGGYGGRGRGHSHQQNNYNDGFQPQGRQDNYQQRQGKDQQQFNKKPYRNQEEGSYQNNRNQRAHYNQNRSTSPNYQPDQRQPYQGYQRGRNEHKPNYQRNRVQQQTEHQQRPRQRNYEQQPRQRQYQRNDYPPRASVRGRGRGGERGRGRGRGRQFPQKQVEAGRDQKSSQKDSENASESFIEQKSQIEQQHQNQSENEQSQESGSMQQASNSQSQEAQSENQDQHSENDKSEVYEQVKRNGTTPMIDGEVQEDMERIDVMCSKQQFQQRLQTFKMNNRGRQAGLRLDTGRSFAIFQINKRTNQPDIALTLKRFRRSTNRGEDENQKEQTADCPRSRKGLTLTLKHILREIIDSDGMRARDLAFPMPPSQQKIEFLHIYDFLWNRMRQMIKDVSRLQTRDRDTQEVITICEQMLRFFIIAVKEGRQPHTCRLQFDPKMNLESITKILTQLLQIYQNNHNALSKESQSNAFISPNQPEIMAYAILISHDLQNTLYQKLRLRADGYGINHPLLNCKEINRALQIKKALKIRDYQSFYRILESQQTDYLQACLLIHHLPMVRRQTLKIFQKACEVQVSTKTKRIPLQILKRNLRFSNKLNKEFREFIGQIGLKIVSDANQNYAILNEFNQSLQDYICSYAFDFPQNKKDRKFYPNSKKKASLINANVISKEQLIKRQWYQGSYVAQSNFYYNKAQAPVEQKQQNRQFIYSQKVIQHLAKINNQQKIILPSLQTRQEVKQDKKNLNFLLEKKKEFARSKFVKSLQGLIQDLVRKSDVHSQHQRRRGLQILFEFIEMLQLIIKQKAFNRMRQYIQNQKIVFEALQNMKTLALKRQKLLSTHYSGCFQFNTFNSGIQFNRLSKIVNYKPNKSFNLLNQLNLVAESYPLRKQLKVLVLFVSSNQLPLQQMHVEFLKNLILYMSGQLSSTSHLGKQIQNLCQEQKSATLSIIKKLMMSNQHLQLKLTFYHSRIQSSQHHFYCGYDAIVLVDLHNDSKLFKKMMGQFLEKRKSTMQSILGNSQKLSTLIAHLKVAKIEKFRQKDSNTGLKELQGQIFSKHLLQQQSHKLSSTLRHIILQILTQSMRKQQAQKVEFEQFPLTNLISQIEQNLTFVESTCKEPLSIVLFQKYLKANIKCINNAIRKMAQNYQRYDWKDFLLKLYSSKSSETHSKVCQVSTQIDYPQQRVDLNSLLSQKLQFSNQLAFLLQQTNFFSRFQNKMKEMPYITYYRALADAIQDYLSSICLQSRPYALELVCQFICENNCALQNKQGKIIGQCKALINFIFVQLKKTLKDINIILPKDFKFSISKDILQNKSLSRKAKKIQKQIEKQIMKLQKIQENIPKNPFKYKHQNLLKRLSKQIDQGDFEQEDVRNIPQKAIKT